MRKLLATLTSLTLLVTLASCSSTPGNADVTLGASDTAEWSMQTAPNYYRVTGPADLDGESIPTTPTIQYAPLDGQGRAGKAVGLISKDMRDAGSRRERNMPDQIPAGPSITRKCALVSITVSSIEGTYLTGRI